ncbi:PREDICTED: phosphatidylinositol-glycan biosynthesis class X protein [Nanorana parkeri]|uniref:phosphatidylinositol-glycan biosynthesis class X protein n=1 Tax=Nanorana parkeri TaxID=125878 RepID=UPI000854BC67|nr:PREDICTED: phosphatidylinositol-glycan biosynthesis class X protein [Nanorana parkeri]
MSKLQIAVVSVLLISIRSAASTGAEYSCLQLKVEREILKNGFHRDLVTRVSVQGYTEQVDSCRILLNETIPSGLFMDPYQISSQQQHNLVEVIVPKSIDIEAPEYLSKGHTALVYMKPDESCNDCYISTVPVHARYHRSSADVYEVSIRIHSPQLLIRCSKDFPPRGCSSHPLVIAPCGSSTGEECQWMDVPYTLVNDNTIVKVPVGIVQHGPVVCIVTIAVTLICTGMLIRTIYKHKQKST